MVARLLRIGQAACLVALFLLVTPIRGLARSRTFSVKDAIEMEAFTDPFPFPAEDYATKDVKYSPDNHYFAVVTQRGLLATNELESTIWVFDNRAVAALLKSTSGAAPPKPRAVTQMAAVSNDPTITQLRWISNTELAFLGRRDTSNRSVYREDVITKTQKRLTPDGQDVTAFDIVGDTAVYTVSLGSSKTSVPIERVATGRPLYALLDRDIPDFVSDGKPAQLWIARPNRTSVVLDHTTGKPLEVVTNLLSLSPSSDAVVIAQYPERIPKAWEAYDPFPCDACKKFRLRGTPPEQTQVDLAFRMQGPKQYSVVYLDSGRVEPIDGPLGLMLLYAGPEEAIWIDNSLVVLVDTFLPLENGLDEAEQKRRMERPCVAVFDISTQHASCITTVKQTSREEFTRTGTGFFLRDVEWNNSTREVALKYETLGHEDSPVGYERPPEVYRLDKHRWIPEDKISQEKPGLTSVDVRQDLNEPPALFVNENDGRDVKKLWDPNAELQDIDLGEVATFQWKDGSGRTWSGGLVKPPAYVSGHRYPLVIQTHGYNKHEFMTVGSFATAFAARPIAATGIVVLQVGDDDVADLQGTPGEGAMHLGAYLAAIDQLASKGIVDPDKVGIIGFSRTGYYTEEALTKAPTSFKAATIADSFTAGYFTYLLSVDSGVADIGGQTLEGNYGGPPFGNGLKTWIERAPTFNLDKVIAPVRIEAHDLSSLLTEWELYAALRRQQKPVDLIQLPDAVHVLTKPLERLASEQGDVDWFDFWLNGHEDSDPAKADQYARWRLLRQLRDKNAKNKRAEVH